MGPTFLRLRGAVDPELQIEGGDAEAAVVWVTAVQGELCVETSVPPFVPQLLTYELEVLGPPALAADLCVPRPPDFDPSTPVAFGVVLLVDPDPGASWDVGADPGRLLGWFADAQPSLTDTVSVTNGKLVAAAERFALMVDGSTGRAAFSDAYCRFDELVSGLTLYRDRSLDCGGWQPAASAGRRTEFQGVDLVALP
ncbi:MAG: hypothetical protein KTR31_10075 [Myxococcales bacterium]|nr:hypothetical protein [Myxococcales bacterium]